MRGVLKGIPPLSANKVVEDTLLLLLSLRVLALITTAGADCGDTAGLAIGSLTRLTSIGA